MNDELQGKPDWEAVQHAFVVERQTYKQCAERFCVPLRTIEYHGGRGQWVKLRRTGTEASMSVARLVAEQTALQIATATAREVASQVATLTAQTLLERHICESNAWLDTIEAMRQQAEKCLPAVKTVRDFCALVAAWERVIKTARLAFPELDQPQEPRLPIRPGVVRQLVIACEEEMRQAEKPAIAVESKVEPLPAVASERLALPAG